MLKQNNPNTNLNIKDKNAYNTNIKLTLNVVIFLHGSNPNISIIFSNFYSYSY